MNDHGSRPTNSSEATAGPLAGIRVIDLSTVVMTPFATQILGDFGADVITVEPTTGSTARIMSPGPHPQLSGIALNLLRNKRNLAIDLKQPRARAIVQDLVAEADVFVTNLRPGPLRRLGFDYPTLAARNPGLVFCNSQGFPSDSPEADDPAYDDIIQAAAGVSDLFRRVSGVPGLAPTVLADKVSGMTLASAVLAALVHRERTGEGQQVEVAMTTATQAFVLVEHAAAATARPPQGEPGYQRILNAERRPRPTKDSWILILPYSRENYDTLFLLGGRNDLVGDVRYSSGRRRIANAAALYELVGSITPLKTTAEWLDLCREHDIPAMAVATLDELVDALPTAHHPVVGDYAHIPNGARFMGTPLDETRLPAALPGGDSVEVLREAAVSDAEITQLIADGVVIVPAAD
jgi:crotonobetainyl-CoA:carnitine CoA-transferase CaiB-like acyl-CoA transferase